MQNRYWEIMKVALGRTNTQKKVLGTVTNFK